MKRRVIFPSLLITILVGPFGVGICEETHSPQAPDGMLRDDPHRPVGPISRDLGISPDDFRGCFNEVHPARQGTRPTQERVHANKEVLLSCLQTKNPDITNEILDTVMDRYRPGGHEAQEPK